MNTPFVSSLPQNPNLRVAAPIASSSNSASQINIPAPRVENVITNQPLISSYVFNKNTNRVDAIEKLTIPIRDLNGRVVGEVDSDIVIKSGELVTIPGQTSLYGHLAPTSYVLSDHNQNLLTLADPKNATQIKVKQDEQRKLEEEYFKDGFVCPVSKLNSIRDRISSIDPIKYKNILREYFYDPAIMRAAMCTAESIAYMPPLEGGNISNNIRIKRWIRSLHRINDELAEGYAMKTGLNRADDTFIIKAPKEDKNLVLLHEYFIGVYGLNKLRAQVPNFAYILGGFKCSAPVIDSKKDVVAWCNNNAYPVDYVVYENITPGMTMELVIKGGCTFEEWLGYYLQILYADQLAYQTCDFTHYDLHTDSLIIREIPKNLKDANGHFYIPYPTEKGIIEYIRASKIATMVDYGFSHIKYRGKSFGVYDKMAWGVLPNRGFPLFDAYKLLMFSLKNMNETGNLELFNMTSNILRFFNATESASDVLASQEKTYYYLPHSEASDKLSIFDLTKYIRNIYNTNNLIVANPESNILGCQNGQQCYTEDDFYISIGLSTEPVANTVFDFYDLITRLEDGEQYAEIDKIINQFDYNSAKLAGLKNYNLLVSKLNALVLGGVIDTVRVEPMSIMKVYVPTENINLSNLFDEQILTNYKNYVYRVAEIYETMQGIYVMHNAIVYTADVFCDDELIKNITRDYDQLRRDVEPSWARVTSAMIEDVNYLRMLISKDFNKPIVGVEIGQSYNYINNQLRLKPIFKWWWTMLPEILEIITVPLNS